MMETLETLLLDVWREACRHIRIEESTAAIAAILCADPRRKVLVRRLDPSRLCLETVAIGSLRCRILFDVLAANALRSNFS